MVERMEREGFTGATGLYPAPMYGSSTGYEVALSTVDGSTPGLSMGASGIPVPQTENHGTSLPLDHKSSSRQHYLDALITLPWDNATEAWSRLPDESHNFLYVVYKSSFRGARIPLLIEKQG
jgi:hypothetical protein